MNSSRLARFIESRRAAAEIGQLRLRFRDINVLRHRVSASMADIRLPEDDRTVLTHEAWKIIVGDCYRLKQMLAPRTRSVLDIGGNIGLFAIACRLRHSSVVVHSYEPNSKIQDLFIGNVSNFRCSPFPFAIGAEGGFARMVEEGGSLHGRTVEVDAASVSEGEQVVVRSFASAVENMNGVDLLKLDCEGAEWELFEVTDIWRRVRAITMEYHLWAKPGATESDLKTTLHDLGYDILTFEPSPHGPWGLLTALRRGKCGVATI